MDHIPASRVKQNFGEVLAQAQHQPVGIERHRKLVAAIVSPQWLAQNQPHDERRSARAAQEQVELQRLMRHQQIGIDLLCASLAQQRSRVQAAGREVDRWEERQLCSEDYISRWRAWLALPVPKLVQCMCGDAQGWGRAMRQNSPFTAGATS